LATLAEMSRIESWELIKKTGREVKKNLLKISKESKLNFTVFGLDSMPSFKMSNNHVLFKTYLTEEMLKKGFLATDSIYISISHNNKNLLNRYFNELMKVCIDFNKKIKSGEIKYQQNELSQSTFSRMN